MTLFDCPYLGQTVELTEERERHIVERHPDLLPEHRDRIAETLAQPDQVRRSTRFHDARLFTRWFDTIRQGKYVVVVVVTDSGPTVHHWIIIAYSARRLLLEGAVEWQKS